ncbi:MAG: penicillin acylase family protein [Rhizobiaceae bacterium]|nr:penicillin acylase family protein [Rhizobiaceae bacterium]
MRRLLKWLFSGVLGLISVVVVLAAIGYGLLVRTIPENNAEVSLTGLGQTTNVVFDAHAIPHIEATSYNDAMRVLGYLHARDRLWQMEVLRMAGQGRLSEMFGAATLDTDRFLRTLGMAEASKTSLNSLMPETRAALQAYSEGVNAYIDREQRTFEPLLGAEFMILSHTPEAWEDWQSVLIIKVMGLNLGANMDTEIKRLTLALEGFSSREIEELLPYGPRDNAEPLPDLLAVYGIQPKSSANRKLPREMDTATVGEGYAFNFETGQSASNNWVISGDRTDTGKPILANDPHLGMTAPSTFYLAHLNWEENGERYNLIGGTIPGVPFVIAGRNDDIAWGLTTTNLDAQDLFLERVDADLSTYQTEDGQKPTDSFETELVYGDELSEALKIVKTRNGPLLPDSYRGIGELLPDGYALSLSWPGLAEDDTTLDTLYSNNRAKTVHEFVKGSSRGVSPMQSIVVADTKGNIGLLAKARSPRRKPENIINGRAPVPGWLEAYRWDGFVPDWQQFAIINPPAGALTTANANFFPPEFSEHITYDWAEHFRQARAEELVLGRNEKHSVSTSRDMLADDYSPAFVQLRDLAQKIMPEGVGLLPEMRAALSEWDGRMQIDRPEPLIMLAWFRHLNIGMLEDDLGEYFPRFERGAITPLLAMLERSIGRDWCDNVITTEKETCAELLQSSLRAANDELVTEFGEDWRDWKYGDAHQAYNEHRPFGQVAALSQYFDIEIPSAGGPYTLLRGQTKFEQEKPYRNRHASAYRAIYDFSDLNKSVFIQSTGQSGNFLSPHYDDLSKIWADLDYVPMSVNPDDYAQNAKGSWVFNP